MTKYPSDHDRPAESSAAARHGSREDQLSRLDRLERDIALERERLGRPDVRDEAETRRGDQPRNGDQRYGDHDRDHVDAVREVDLPDLESKVTESQREAWTLGYQAGLADAQAGGPTTANPFHPLRESRV